MEALTDRADTTWKDAGLFGATEYSYRVIVETIHDEQVPSSESGGAFHRQVAEWPLQAGTDAFVRLYSEPGNRTAALVSTPDEVRLIAFDPSGQRLEERVLWTAYTLYGGSQARTDISSLVPRTVTMALTSDRRRVLGLGRQTYRWIQAWEADGSPWRMRHTGIDVEIGTLLDAAGELEGAVRVEFLKTSFAAWSALYVNWLAISAGNRVVLDESFASGPPPGWQWQLEVEKTAVGEAYPTFGPGLAVLIRILWDFGPTLPHSLWIRTADEYPLQGLRAEVETVLDLFCGVELKLDPASGDSPLSVSLSDANQELSSRLLEVDDAQQMAVVPGLPYQLGFEVADGRFSTWASSPVWWSQVDTDPRPSWMSLAAIGERVAVAVDARRGTLDRAGEEVLVFSGNDDNPGVAEIRVWDTDGEDVPRVGLCLPTRHQVLVGRLDTTNVRGLIWPTDPPSAPYGQALASSAGGGRASFLFPLSLAAGPDGRVYVLDAGNSRIQVFGSSGDYLTEWGGHGSGAGQFDFGSGFEAEDFRGSVAVDDDGSIYVADVGNGRIQVFSPE